MSVPPIEEREAGVLYQHPVYDADYYGKLDAIEVCGFRFERVRECANTVRRKRGVMPMLHCSECGHETELDAVVEFGDREAIWPRYCAYCGAKVAEVDA